MAAVCLKFTCLLLVLLLSSAWLSTGDDSQGPEDAAAISTEKEEFSGRNAIGGRKMVPRKLIFKRVAIKGSGELAESLSISSANQEIAAAGKSGKKKNKVVDQNEGSKQLNNEGGFVAFSADYHAPRHHPPKNN